MRRGARQLALLAATLVFFEAVGFEYHHTHHHPSDDMSGKEHLEAEEAANIEGNRNLVLSRREPEPLETPLVNASTLPEYLVGAWNT